MGENKSVIYLRFFSLINRNSIGSTDCRSKVTATPIDFAAENRITFVMHVKCRSLIAHLKQEQRFFNSAGDRTFGCQSSVHYSPIRPGLSGYHVWVNAAFR